LETKAGTVDLKVPKLRRLPLESAIIERYRRRESSAEEALAEMYAEAKLGWRGEECVGIGGDRGGSGWVSGDSGRGRGGA
jgi:hypothetical protein